MNYFPVIYSEEEMGTRAKVGACERVEVKLTLPENGHIKNYYYKTLFHILDFEHTLISLKTINTKVI